MKWLSWPSTASETRKFRVKAYGFKLNGFNLQDSDSAEHKFMVLAMKIKRTSSYGLFSVHRRNQKFRSKVLLTSTESIEWNQEFDAVCGFSVSEKDQSHQRHRVCIKILYGDSRELKAKSAVLGKVSLDLAELASKMEADIQRKLPISLQVAGVSMEVTLSVSMSFMEVRNAQDSIQLGQNSTESDIGDRFLRRLKGMKLNANTVNQEVSTDGSDESALFDSESSSSTESGSSPSSDSQLDPGRGTGSRRRRRLDFSPASTKIEPLIKKSNNGSTRGTDVGKHTLQSDSQSQTRNSRGRWEVTEVESRDGEAKLKAGVVFASFDQCSAKAAGESACAALAAAVAHWLHHNQHILPTKSQLDILITQGSSDWRNLCDNRNYSTLFPDNHFDLETVLNTRFRPLSLSPDRSFVGFFSPEKFEYLKGNMSFGQIWDKISIQDEEPRVYIISWNDHFFVLMIDAEACYIIDSLGKRLFEGCNQAFILKFDQSAVIYGKAKKGGPVDGPEREVISRGKDCCREFIKRFLAAVPVGDVEAEMKKGRVSHLALYRQLQIDFHFTSTAVPTTTHFAAYQSSSQVRSRFSLGSKAA